MWLSSAVDRVQHSSAKQGSTLQRLGDHQTQEANHGNPALVAKGNKSELH